MHETMGHNRVTSRLDTLLPVADPHFSVKHRRLRFRLFIKPNKNTNPIQF